MSYNFFEKMMSMLRLKHDYGISPSRKRVKMLRPKRFKPAFSSGFRGWRKTEERPGRYPAPTIDQVRTLERKHNIRLHVKNGLIFEKYSGKMFHPLTVNK